MVHLELRAMPAAGNQFRFANDLFGLRRIKQEGIGFDRLVRQTAAAGLFPRQTLVVNRYLKARTGQTLSAERTGRTATNDGYLFHVSCCGPVQVSGKTVEMNQDASIAPNNAAEVAEPVRTRNASVAKRCSTENSAR